MIDRQGFQFDLETQRFIKNRWETETGERVLQEIIDGIKSSVEIRAILDDYVLEHEENIDPYGHPIYPKEAMTDGAFWVLAQDDLRGAHFYNEDLSNSRSLGKKSLSYCNFYNCNLEDSSLDRTDLSYARIEKCNLKNTYLSSGGGFSTRYINSDLQNTLMYGSGFIDCDFSGSDLRGAFLGDTRLENLAVNYLTRFDHHLATQWGKRELSKEQIPDILRAIRIAYEKAELWDEADRFLLEEKRAFRKYILWERSDEKKTLQTRWTWLKSYLIDLFSGYATKPMDIIYTGIIISFAFAIVYTIYGNLSSKLYPDNLLESIYFSFTTFATLGYGDLAFTDSEPYMRILSTSEAWIGAITMALFVTTLARKVFR